MSDDLTDLLAEVIHAAECTAYTHEGRNARCEREARALLPVVRAYADGRVAEALAGAGAPQGQEVGATIYELVQRASNYDARGRSSMPIRLDELGIVVAAACGGYDV